MRVVLRVVTTVEERLRELNAELEIGANVEANWLEWIRCFGLLSERTDRIRSLEREGRWEEAKEVWARPMQV